MNKDFIAGLSLGIGVTLIIDKIWWKYFASTHDFPDHYLLGIILIIAGVAIYYNWIKINMHKCRNIFKVEIWLGVIRSLYLSVRRLPIYLWSPLRLPKRMFMSGIQ